VIRRVAHVELGIFFLQRSVVLEPVLQIDQRRSGELAHAQVSQAADIPPVSVDVGMLFKIADDAVRRDIGGEKRRQISQDRRDGGRHEDRYGRSGEHARSPPAPRAEPSPR